MAYTLNIATGVVIRDVDQQLVAPCQSPYEPDYVAYTQWVAAGHEPAIINVPPLHFEPISRAQLRLALDAAGLTAAVEAAIAAGPAALRIMWEDSQSYHRHHPMVLGVQQALGKSDAELDALWQAAMGIAL
jgi:hypothetical protein